MSRTLIGVLGLLALAGVGRADDATKKADAEAALGTWRQVAVVVDGKDLEVGRATLLTVTPEGYRVTADGKPYQKGTVKDLGGDRIRRMDVLIAEGEGAGSTVPQISTIDGDVLIACQAAPGKARPTAFTSKPGSGHILSVWIRVKKE